MAHDWDPGESELAGDEDSLPDSYDEAWDSTFDWFYDAPIDDRPEWDRRDERRVCRSCGDLDHLDPLRRCGRCRAVAGRCDFCGLDDVRYKRMRACSTCYRWLRRNLHEFGWGEAQEQLRANAAVRHARKSPRR